MTHRHLVVDGEIWVTLEDVAACYGLEQRQLSVWVSEGLLSEPLPVEGHEAWPASTLDRVAVLCRLTFILGPGSPDLSWLAP